MAADQHSNQDGSVLYVVLAGATCAAVQYSRQGNATDKPADWKDTEAMGAE